MDKSKRIEIAYTAIEAAKATKGDTSEMLDVALDALKGGEGSGNWDHEGVQGQLGGSAPSEGGATSGDGGASEGRAESGNVNRAGFEKDISTLDSKNIHHAIVRVKDIKRGSAVMVGDGKIYKVYSKNADDSATLHVATSVNMDFTFGSNSDAGNIRVNSEESVIQVNEKELAHTFRSGK